MPVPHLEIRIVKRNKRKSAVGGAAYQAGEKLFSEYDQKTKDYRRKQHEIVYCGKAQGRADRLQQGIPHFEKARC